MSAICLRRLPNAPAARWGLMVPSNPFWVVQSSETWPRTHLSPLELRWLPLEKQAEKPSKLSNLSNLSESVEFFVIMCACVFAVNQSSETKWDVVMDQKMSKIHAFKMDTSIIPTIPDDRLRVWYRPGQDRPRVGGPSSDLWRVRCPGAPVPMPWRRSRRSVDPAVDMFRKPWGYRLSFAKKWRKNEGRKEGMIKHEMDWFF